MSHYILKNKDRVVLEFEVQIEKIESLVSHSVDFTQKLKNICVVKKDLLPFNFHSTDNLQDDLQLWIRNRKIPQNRQFVENIIATYSQNGRELLMDYIDVSFGLSLNDSFWIVPANKDYKWQEYNLYKNKFNEALEKASFGEELQKISGFTSSPEYTTNGMLKKCWHRENNQIYLYKGQSKEYANGGKEAYSEYYMAQIAEIMEFDYVPYDLKLFHNELVSTCAIFTNENEGYVPMYQMFKGQKWRFLQKTELVNEIAKIYEPSKLQDLLLFDALIMNTDRHLGNFGMIVNNDTLEILRPAPIFDNGLSMMNSLTLKELQGIENIKIQKTSNLGYSFDEQLELFSEKRHIPNLEKLTQFSFQRHAEFNLSEEWLSPIEECIRKRATMALEFIEKKQQHSIQAQNNTNELDKLIESIDQAQSEQDTRVSNKTKQNLFENQESLQTQTNENKALAKKLRRPK